MLRAAIYAKNHSYQQQDKVLSMDEQVHLCKEFAVHEGYEIVEEFQETDMPILQSLLEAAKTGRFDAVIVQGFDRFSLNRPQAAVIIATLLGYGMKVLSVTEDTFPDEIEASLQKMQAALNAEVDRIQKERMPLRIKAGIQAKRQKQG